MRVTHSEYVALLVSKGHIEMGHFGQTGIAQGRTEKIRSGRIILHGEVSVTLGAIGVDLFASGSGSGRHSPRNQFVVRTIRSFEASKEG